MIRTVLRVPGIHGSVIWEGQLPLVSKGLRIDVGAETYRVISTILRCQELSAHQLVMVEKEEA
jgi:hypothetical protein